MKAIIFVGPSLPPAVRPVLPEIEWRPPARQGDVYRAALEKPAIIGVVDGVFEVVPTVWHKEILWAMSRGIHVYGAASIGALRAAELDVFGMVGIGRVYENFRDGVLEDDDEVALLHGPEETGYVPVTEAMVNVRATIAVAIEASAIPDNLAAWLQQTAKAMFYKDRTWPAIAAAASIPAASKLPRIDHKRSDAQAMASVIAAHLTTIRDVFSPAYCLAETARWAAVMDCSI